MERQLVIFELAHELYGVEIAFVESIIKMQAVTAIPHTEQFVEGVINLRGSVLPVIDLHKRLGLPAKVLSKNSRIIVVMANNTKVGMIVDMVCEVLNVSGEAIEPPPAMIAGADAEVIIGIAKIADRLVILLDLGKLLSDV